MELESLREYCLSKKGSEECLPFDDETLVFKVMGKIFLITNLEGEAGISIKVEPEEGLSMREQYPAVLPAWHMNKLHWVTVSLDGTVEDSVLRKWIDCSYALVVNGLTRKLRLELDDL